MRCFLNDSPPLEEGLGVEETNTVITYLSFGSSEVPLYKGASLACCRAFCLSNAACRITPGAALDKINALQQTDKELPKDETYFNFVEPY